MLARVLEPNAISSVSLMEVAHCQEHSALVTAKEGLLVWKKTDMKYASAW